MGYCVIQKDRPKEPLDLMPKDLMFCSGLTLLGKETAGVLARSNCVFKRLWLGAEVSKVLKASI